MNSIVPIIGWLGWLSAAAALVIYFAAIARRPQWIRLLTGSGLFFTGCALAIFTPVLPRAQSIGLLGPSLIAEALMVAAVMAQGFAILRNRQAWDGHERRRGEGGT